MSWTVAALGSPTGVFTGATATTVTLTASASANDTVVLFLENGNVVTYTVSDSAGGNTYTATDTNIANSTGQGLSAWYSKLTNAVTSFTITASGGTLAFYVLAGLKITNTAGTGITFHGHISATGGSSGTPSSGAAAFTSGDVTIGGCCTGTTQQTISAGSNYTIVNQAGTTFDYADEQGTTNGTATFSIATADFWSALALTFSPPSGTYIPPRRLVKTYSLNAKILH